jgi:hypothetical protein
LPEKIKPHMGRLVCLAPDGREEDGAATKDWSKANPAIFGALFQQSMDAVERHANSYVIARADESPYFVNLRSTGVFSPRANDAIISRRSRVGRGFSQGGPV